MGETTPSRVLEGEGLRVAVAMARYNEQITSGLLAGAREYLTASKADFDVFEVPGAFELPVVCARLARAEYDAVVALGAVIEGETDHYEHVAGQAAEGLMQVALDTGKPIAFGVLTVREEGHAMARSAPGAGNKGTEAAAAALETALLMRRIARGV